MRRLRAGLQLGRPLRRRLTARSAGFVLVLAPVLVQLPLASPASADQGWRWPLSGPREVARGFAPPASRYGTGHRGADLPGSGGEPVLAAGGGVVSHSGQLAGRGVVVVTHGALRTTYEPVTGLLPVGTQVAAGAVIGSLESGHQGCPVAACLHWGLRRGEDYLDPLGQVDRRPARLLPLGAPAGGTGSAGAPAGPHDGSRGAQDPPRLHPAFDRGALAGPAVVGAGALTAGWLGRGRRRPAGSPAR